MDSDKVRAILVQNCDNFKPLISARIQTIEYINSIVDYEKNMMKSEFARRKLKSPYINHIYSHI